jgi:hypothetical protein
MHAVFWQRYLLEDGYMDDTYQENLPEERGLINIMRVSNI